MQNINTTIMAEIIEAAEHYAIEFQLVGIRMVSHNRITVPHSGETLLKSGIRVEFSDHQVFLTRHDCPDSGIHWTAYGSETEYTQAAWAIHAALERSAARHEQV